MRHELQPIARRHGRELLSFAVQVAAANTALDQLLLYSQTHSKIGPQVSLLLSATTDMARGAAAARGWTLDQLAECMLDISRASRLAMAAPQVGRQLN